MIRHIWIFLFLCSSLILMIGCAPSIRYTRSENGEIHYYVPRDWDYRKNYKVPGERILAIADTYKGTPYRFAGMSRRGVDCSGFVCLVFDELNHFKLPHSSRKMSHLGKDITLSQARVGDLVFFKSSIFGIIDHVGIYAGDNRIIHSSSGKGVGYSSLDESYYKKHLAGIRRLF